MIYQTCVPPSFLGRNTRNIQCVFPSKYEDVLSGPKADSHSRSGDPGEHAFLRAVEVGVEHLRPSCVPGWWVPCSGGSVRAIVQAAEYFSRGV